MYACGCILTCVLYAVYYLLFLKYFEFSFQLPFPLIGTLNGIQMFAASRDMELQSTTTENSKVFWKVFHNR